MNTKEKSRKSHTKILIIEFHTVLQSKLKNYSRDYLKDKELRIVHFGLIEKYIGKGLGIKLMNAAITRAYNLNIKKIILQTNSLDHKRALPFYKEYGFEVFAEETKNLIYAIN